MRWLKVYKAFAFALACLLMAAGSINAAPITLYFEGTVPSYGVDARFTSPAVAVGDFFSGWVTFDPNMPETSSFPNTANFYRDAILEISVVFSTSGGPVSYLCDDTVLANTINQIALWNSRLSLEVTDFQRDGALPPITGPDEAGHFSGQDIVFKPQFMRFDVNADYSSHLAAHSLPAAPFSEGTWMRVSIGFDARLSSSSGLGGWYYGSVETAYLQQADLIPEPATLSLVGLGLVGLVNRLRKRS